MMKKKVLLGLTALTMSAAALAGGGGSSWQPSVGPAHCIKNSPEPQVDLVWNDIPACNEVISKGYASGVYVSGTLVYQGGQTTRGYSGFLKPGQNVKMDYPKEINGSKFIGTASSNHQWLN